MSKYDIHIGHLPPTPPFTPHASSSTQLIPFALGQTGKGTLEGTSKMLFNKSSANRVSSYHPLPAKKQNFPRS